MALEPSDVIHAFLEELTHTHMNIYTSKLAVHRITRKYSTLVFSLKKYEVRNIHFLNHVLKVIYLRHEMINS